MAGHLRGHVHAFDIAAHAAARRPVRRMNAGRAGALAATAAALACAGAAALAGAALEGYSHSAHPLGLLGARQLGAGGLAFGWVAFVLPGAVQAWQAVRLRSVMPPAAGWAQRIGLQLVLLAALAFAAQGLLRLDMDSLDAGASRWHALAWLVWAMAFPLGACAAAVGAWRRGGSPAFAAALVLAGMLVAAGAFLGAGAMAPLAQRGAVLAWLAWGAWAAWRPPLSRGAA